MDCLILPTFIIGIAVILPHHIVFLQLSILHFTTHLCHNHTPTITSHYDRRVPFALDDVKEPSPHREYTYAEANNILRQFEFTRAINDDYLKALGMTVPTHVMVRVPTSHIRMAASSFTSSPSASTPPSSPIY
jgi:hypothetical protein